MGIKSCPLLWIAACIDHDQPCTCQKEECALWDEGAYDVFAPGCGLVPRKNRRV